jgi:serine/threonine protein kinase
MSILSDDAYPYTRYFSDISVQQTTHSPIVACDFIKFLTSIQELEVDILPITWQTTQQPIGAGGTSNVNEASQNVHRSFAFKRIADRHKTSEQEGKLFQMVLNEIAILSHRIMRECPNIIELEGICWDIESESNIWPVLVFDKTHWGDLRTFVRKLPWKTLTVATRLHLCTEVGSAISYMHDNSMYLFHGCDHD